MSENRIPIETLTAAAIAAHRGAQFALADAAVRSGFCPDCGRSEFGRAAGNGSRMLTCVCGSAFLIEKPYGS